MGIYTKQWIPLNSIAKDVRIAEHERDLLKGLKPATVVEPNNQEDIAIGGLHPHLYTASQYALQAQKGRSWRVAYIYIYVQKGCTHIYIYIRNESSFTYTSNTSVMSRFQIFWSISQEGHTGR